MHNQFDLLKHMAGAMSSILIIAGFLVWLVKPFRARFSKWVQKQCNTKSTDLHLEKIDAAVDGIASSVKEIKESLDEHIKQNNIDTKIANDAHLLSLRCQIREIYMRNYKTKSQTVREHSDAHDLCASYHAQGGNGGYMLSLLEEMTGWEKTEGL